MQRPPKEWGDAIMLKLFIVLCLLIHCHAKSHHAKSHHKRPLNGSTLTHLLKSKKHPVNAVKRTGWHQDRHFDRGVPEHFDFHEHGPEIHLDIDECGSRVDTHPAALDVDTSTDPHEHCCSHCHQHCECGGLCHCGDDCCCDKRSLDHVEHHNDYDEHQVPGAQLIQHTLDNTNSGEICTDTGEGGCPSRGDTEQCYGGVCRDHVANFQPHFQPFQYSDHAARKPLHSIYDLPASTPGIDNYHPVPHLLLAEHINKDEQGNGELQKGFSRITQDSHVGHSTGLTRGTIGIDTPIQSRVSNKTDSSSYGDEDAPKLVTFGRNEGIALKNEEINHNADARELAQGALGLKRSGVKPLKRSKRC